jgi:hypothetical protein
MLILDRFRCDGCGAEIREAISTSPFGAFSNNQPWIYRRSSHRHFCSPECLIACEEQRRDRERERRTQATSG